MNIYPDDDTIAAIATPIGVGGISVIRISGKNSFEVADKGFRGKSPLCNTDSHTVHFGKFVDSNGETIDEVLATVFRSPNSYTTDDTVEISCHGGMYVARKILELVLIFGARMAQPGEFTKRAFLNGRIDLAQSEAIADIIRSGSEVSHKASMRQLEGRLSQKIKNLREVLLKTCGLLELELDFSEEGLEFIDKFNIIKEIDVLSAHLQDMLDSYSLGKIYREGVKVVLTGRPNVGKSSLLNALLNEERAIVTEIPGTTRDIIEENIHIEGILFKLVDTAGIRESIDRVEKEGIRRSEYQLEEADIILIIFDATQEFNAMDQSTLDMVFNTARTHQSMFVIENKIDLVADSKYVDIPSINPTLRRIRLSAKTGEGLKELRMQLSKAAVVGSVSTNDKSIVISNIRHKNCLILAMESLICAKNALENNKSNDLVSIDLRGALAHLGEITGEVTSEDVINNIFSNFCIGK